MGTKRKYTVTVIPDEEGEPFSPSSCKCKECMSMHIAQLEWDTFKPETHLQRKMMAIVAKLENDIKAGKKSNIRTIPKKMRKRRKYIS
jgi:hypothetical protein